ncbi:MAG: hypothetical protein LBV12_04290 [Puniceicoccales bacterium]|jgi:hypothetical protein|nr:hypothetical protein [Puniceicoccales bacterium]
MEWQVKPISRRCAVSDQPLKPGDRVTCIIYKPEGLPIERADILEEHVPEFSPAGLELGRWTREVKDRAEEEREARQQLLATREEFFLSLFSDDTDPTGDKAVLKQLLALLLERKRILRALGKPENNIQHYLHVRTRDEYSVPTDEFQPEQIAQIQPALETLVG